MTQRGTCAICQKLKPIGNGWFYTVEYLKSIDAVFTAKPDSYGGIFVCFRCIDQLEHEHERKVISESPIMKLATQIRAEQAQKAKEKRTIDKERQTLLKILRLRKDEWVRLKDITEEFRQRGFFNMSSHYVVVILDECGFKERKRRGHGGWLHVHIGKK